MRRNVTQSARPTGAQRTAICWLAVFLGEDLLVYLVLALGAALAVGNGLALVRPPTHTKSGELTKAPVGRSLVMIAIGTLAAVWALASLITK